jgi:tetratricopeptide (TPR) repeat protein
MKSNHLILFFPGTFDIKQSLTIKLQTERNSLFNIPEEADPTTILMLGMREIKNGNLENGVSFLSKAIDICPDDQGALIARSKCYMKLGAPEKALQDAETALSLDPKNIRAIFQKAEALYYMGNFEHSLMFFHRGLKLRPELACFRLGIQKTQEAIENTIGGVQKAEQCISPDFSKTSSPTPSKISSTSSKHSHTERKQAKKLLGELFVDKEYLEKLLKHPDLKKADTKTENVSPFAKDAISFLNNRKEFWRQQKPTTSGHH